jgi:ssDNA-binding Zn-finger/Zn-ribbon topoisomerase 1
MIEDTKCPVCDGPMTSRKNSTTGQRFWGCNQYPKCKGTRNTDGDAPRRNIEDVEDDRAMPSDRFRQNDRGRWRNQ